MFDKKKYLAFLKYLNSEKGSYEYKNYLKMLIIFLLMAFLLIGGFFIYYEMY